MPGKLPHKDTKPDSNWVEKAGGLPPYIEDIAVNLHKKHGDVGRAIAEAVETCRRWAAGGTVRKNGGPKVKPDTQAKAAAALAQWEAKKGKSKLAAGVETDQEFALNLAVQVELADDEDFDMDTFEMALAQERTARGTTEDDLPDVSEEMPIAGTTVLNEGHYALALSQERKARGLDLAGPIKFNPELHPRDLTGKFRTVVKGLATGQTAELPDGTKVKSLDNGYSVQRKGQKVAKVGSAREAADSALDTSAKSDDDHSAIGGKKSYKNAKEVEKVIADSGAEDEPLTPTSTPSDQKRPPAKPKSDQDGERKSILPPINEPWKPKAKQGDYDDGKDPKKDESESVGPTVDVDPVVDYLQSSEILNYDDEAGEILDKLINPETEEPWDPDDEDAPDPLTPKELDYLGNVAKRLSREESELDAENGMDADTQREFGEAIGKFVEAHRGDLKTSVESAPVKEAAEPVLEEHGLKLSEAESTGPGHLVFMSEAEQDEEEPSVFYAQSVELTDNGDGTWEVAVFDEFLDEDGKRADSPEPAGPVSTDATPENIGQEIKQLLAMSDEEMEDLRNQQQDY